MPPGMIDTISFISTADTPVLLILFIYGLHRSWIVLGGTHEREVTSLQKQLDKETKRADTWQAQALRSTNLAEWAKQLLESGTGTGKTG